MIRSETLLRVVALAWLCGGASASAELPVAVDEGGGAVVGSDDPSGPSLAGDYSYTFDGDFDGGGGGLSVGKVRASGLVPFMLGDDLRLQLGASYQRFDFDARADFVPDHMQGVAALVRLEYLVGGQPAVGLRASPGVYFIDDADADSFDVPTILYAGWRWSPSLVSLVGASYSGLRTDHPVLPLGGFIWTISDGVKLNALLPVASLDVQVSDTVEVSLIGEYSGLRVQTGSGLQAAELRDTELRYAEIRAGVRLSVAVTAATDLMLSGGWAFRQEFEFDELDRDFETGGAPFVGVSLRTSF